MFDGGVYVYILYFTLLICSGFPPEPSHQWAYLKQCFNICRTSLMIYIYIYIRYDPWSLKCVCMCPLGVSGYALLWVHTETGNSPSALCLAIRCFRSFGGSTKKSCGLDVCHVVSYTTVAKQSSLHYLRIVLVQLLHPHTHTHTHRQMKLQSHEACIYTETAHQLWRTASLQY